MSRWQGVFRSVPSELTDDFVLVVGKVGEEYDITKDDSFPMFKPDLKDSVKEIQTRGKINLVGDCSRLFCDIASDDDIDFEEFDNVYFKTCEKVDFSGFDYSSCTSTDGILLGFDKISLADSYVSGCEPYMFEDVPYSNYIVDKDGTAEFSFEASTGDSWFVTIPNAEDEAREPMKFDDCVFFTLVGGSKYDVRKGDVSAAPEVLTAKEIGIAWDMSNTMKRRFEKNLSDGFLFGDISENNVRDVVNSNFGAKFVRIFDGKDAIVMLVPGQCVEQKGALYDVDIPSDMDSLLAKRKGSSDYVRTPVSELFEMYERGKEFLKSYEDASLDAADVDLDILDEEDLGLDR